MTQQEVEQILIEYYHLFKDNDNDHVIYIIDGIERYISGYKLQEGIFTLYLAPTKNAIERGIILSDSIEWSEFLDRFGNVNGEN